MLWVFVLLGCDSASMSDVFVTFVMRMKPGSYVDTSGTRLPIDEATNAKRKHQLHLFMSVFNQLDARIFVLQ